MKSMKVVLLLLLSSFSIPQDNATSVLHEMYNRYKGKWQKTLRFVQHTEKYRNDSLIGTETWYETIVYPDMFRIDFGNPANGNCVIFRNDSVYIFKDHQLNKQKHEGNDLLFLIGGMYYAPNFDTVIERLTAMHYDIRKGHKTKWKGKSAYVIGANNEDEHVNQLFIARDNFNILKSVKYDGDKKKEVIFEKHIPAGGGWSETLVTFYSDGHLVQKEAYRDVVANDNINPAIFSPTDPWQWHWHMPEK